LEIINRVSLIEIKKNYLRGDGSSSLGMSVHFRNDYSAEVSTLFESAALSFCGLT
jgi:hypothetical protein